MGDSGSVDMPDGLSPSMLMSMMMTVLNGGQQQDAPGLYSYHPRFLNPDMGPNAYMGFGTIGSQFGPMGRSLGMMATAAGFTLAPDMMSRLMGNQNADMMALQQQQLLHHTQMHYLFNEGQQIANALGRPDMGGTLNKIVPWLQGIPGVGDLISALNPNQITASGAQAMAMQARMMDPGGQIRTSNLNALERARSLMTERNGLRDVAAMSGFNQDEFADLGLFAMDQGFTAQFDREQVRQAARKQRTEEKFAGRSYASLTPEQRATVDYQVEADVKGAAIYQGAIGAGKAVRSLMNTFGVDRQTAMALGQSFGVTAGSADDVEKIRAAAREIEAFGKAAGTSGTELLNMAKVLQSQNGGTLLFQTQVAAMSNLVGRYSQQQAVESGMRMDVGDSARQGAMDVMAGWAGGADRSQLFSMLKLADHKQRAEILQSIDRGDVAARLETARRGGVGRDLLGAHLTAEELNESEQSLIREIGPEKYQRMVAKLSFDESARIARSDPRIAMYLNKSPQDRFAIDQFMTHQVTDIEEVARRSHSTIPELRDLTRALETNVNRGTYQRNLFGSDMVLRTLDQTAATRHKIESNRAFFESEAIQRLQENQGLLPALFTGKISKPEDVLASMGYLRSKRETDFVNYINSDQDQKDAFVGAGQQVQSSMQVLNDPKASEEDKTAALNQLTEAQTTLRGFGIKENRLSVLERLGTSVVRDKQGILRTDEGVQVVNDMGAGQDSDDAIMKAKAATKNANLTAGGAGGGGTQNVNVGGTLDINLNMGGQQIPATDFSAQARSASDNIHYTVNGTKPMSGSHK